MDTLQKIKKFFKKELQNLSDNSGKKDQSKILPTIQKKLLSKRNIVENLFSWVQNYRRIRVRYEVYLDIYIQFYYLALIETVVKKFDI